MYFKGKSPCNNCPYRKDAPLQFWSKEEFQDLIKKEALQFGTVYVCHKNNGTVCKGWLMDQDKRDLPSIALRLKLSRENVTREYLDSLNCDSEIYESVKQMSLTNYTDIKC